MPIIQVTAPAKLNLFLHVTGRRPDGFHLLESLIVFTEFGDTLEFEAADELFLHITGPLAHSLNAHDNLVFKAAHLLREHAGVKSGAKITLHKHIPIGAGLGGGSSDAAAALRGLEQLWGLKLGESDRLQLAMQLGSDVPVCLNAKPGWVSGVGENVQPVAVSGGAWVVLANPGVPLATADVFRRFSERFAETSSPFPESIDSVAYMLRFLKPMRNALEAPAMELLPVIGEVLAALRATGCGLARMSGSGATCFGLYEKSGEAQAAAREIERLHPEWFVKATPILLGI